MDVSSVCEQSADAGSLRTIDDVSSMVGKDTLFIGEIIWMQV